VEAGQVLAADALGKWKTLFQLAYLTTGLVWLTTQHPDIELAIGKSLGQLARPAREGGLLQLGFLWLAVALTVISGWNYLWSSRSLLKAKS